MNSKWESFLKVERSEIERRLEQFKAAARAAGLKLTHQRVEIFREVAASLEHPDAVAVFRAVQARMPTVSLDTVYRTLWSLHDLGVVATLGPRRESVRFDANLAHHHHYLCVRCGLARDFDSSELNALRIPGAVEEFGSVVATHVEVRGVCHRCAGDAARKSVSSRPKTPSGQKRRGK
jgi:Fur family transcriptional regulator, peroxide stress response regulator